MLPIWLFSLAAAQDPPEEPAEPEIAPVGEPDSSPADGSPQTPEEAPETLPITEPPAILEYVEAPYPPGAFEQGLEGTVLLVLDLDEAGEVTNVEIKQGLGNGFDEAAVDAVLAMRFSPAMTEAGPVAVRFEFAYTFSIGVEPVPVEDLPEPPVNLEGTVREMGTRAPLAGVTVRLVDLDLETTSDAAGAFSFRGVPPGSHPIRFVHPGHVPADAVAEVGEGEVTSARYWLRADSYRENEVLGIYHRVQDEVTRRTLSIQEVRRIPGTFGDPVKVIQTLPGAARTPFGTGFLVIRGSNPDDSGVYVDGIRIPLIYHLTGTTSVLQPEVIESVDYLPGGFGVQYGRSMGGVIDIESRHEFTDQSRLSWGTDILDSQLFYEGKLGKNKKHGLAVGARRSYIDLFIPIFTRGTDFTLSPRYWDYQLKYVPDLPHDEVDAFVYGFHDVLEVATPEDVAQGPDQDTQGDLKTEYLSHRVVLGWERAVGDDFGVRVSPSFGYDYGYFGLGQDFSIGTTSWIAQLRAEAPWSLSPAVEVVPGLDVIGVWWSFDFVSAIRITDLDDPLSEREGIAFGGNGGGWSPDAFLKVNLRPLADDRILLTPGVRLSTFVLTQRGEISGDLSIPAYSQADVDPRLLGRAQVFEGGVLKASTGLYNQPPQPPELVGVGTRSTTKFERSWATSLGFEHQVTQAIRWDLDLFYKDMSRLIVYDEEWSGFGSNPFENEGRGRAYGTELMVRHEPANNFFGWVSYTLSRSERKDHPGDPWHPFELDQTHIFSAQGGYDLPWDFGVSAQVQAVSGNPDTSFDAGVYDVDGNFYNGFQTSAYGGERLPPFIQTSFRVDKLWTFKRWQMEVYLDLLNIVRGVNPEFTLYNYDFTESAYVRGLPFIPNLGLEARFWL